MKFLKKTVCHELVKEVNGIQTTDASNLVQKSWLWHKNWWNWKQILDNDHSK